MNSVFFVQHCTREHNKAIVLSETIVPLAAATDFRTVPRRLLLLSYSSELCVRRSRGETSFNTS
jgi:hypothetical protein